MHWVKFELMEEYMVKVFIAAGVPEDDARICAEVLIESDKRGIDSHGIGRLKPIYIDRIIEGIINPITKIDIIKDGPTTAVLDGNNGMGQVVSKHAMSLAIEKARKFGMGMVAVRNSNHYGIAGYYATMATEQGMIGMTGTNARPSIAPTFGVENMLGTNPLVFGMPTDEAFPFVLDCATSITQRGKIEVYQREGKTLPEGWVIGADGNPRTDTEQVLKDLLTGGAALAPLGGIGEELGGYKGYGFATIVEILSAALQGGVFLKALSGFQDSKKVPYKLGHFFMAIDVEAFTTLDEFKKTTGDILRELRASKKAPGENRIYTAGEKEYLAWEYRKNKGVPINDALEKDIAAIEKIYGITI
ncbi:MAG: Ldh family oxidoreductase [Dethiosulfatibacter sp.]|nr:Ldh family oxidoreductase [Dethiosulfatibacter sp.]